MADKIKVALTALHPIALLSGRVERGASFEATESEAERHIKAGLAVRGVVVSAPDGAVKVLSGDLKWKKKISPRDYLEKYPNGPEAVLAAQIVAAEDAASAEETLSDVDDSDESGNTPPTE
jgi:hypothetical protein